MNMAAAVHTHCGLYDAGISQCSACSVGLSNSFRMSWHEVLPTLSSQKPEVGVLQA